MLFRACTTTSAHYIFFLPVFLGGLGDVLISRRIPCLLVSIFNPCRGALRVASRLVTAPAAAPFGGGVVPVPSSF